MQIISTEKIGIALIQKPYLCQNRPKGIAKGYRKYIYGDGKSTAAIVIPNNALDALLITQLPNNDAVLLEIHNGSKCFYAASVYLDYNDSIENNLKF